MTLQDYLDAIKKRLADATPGPWKWGFVGLNDLGIKAVKINTVGDLYVPLARQIMCERDAYLIASAPTDLARLVKIIEVQWQALECDQREHLVMGICEHCEARAAVEKIVNEEESAVSE